MLFDFLGYQGTKEERRLDLLQQKQDGIPIAHLPPSLNSFIANVNKLTKKRWQ